MNVLIIANPLAGKGRAARELPRLVEILESRGTTTEVLWTEHQGHATSFLRETFSALAKAEGGRALKAVVVVGGDGTLLEAVNGLPLPCPVPLVVWGLGSQNILARELGLPDRAEGVAELVLNGRPQPVDVGEIEGTAGTRRFISVCGTGLGAQVIRYIEQRRRGHLGAAGYVWPFLRAVASNRDAGVTVEVENGETVRGAMVLVCNIRQYVWNFRPAEHARCDSGIFEVVVPQHAGPGWMLRYVSHARRGVSNCPGMKVVRGKVLRLTSDNEDVPVQIRGLPSVAAC